MMVSCRQQKMCLIKMLTGCYFSPAATLLAVGRCNPGNTKATTSASCAFFIVATLFATVRHFMVWCIGNGRTGGQHTARFMMHHATMSMVALAGPLSGGPGSFVSGIATPVRAIASERCNSSDSFMLITKEAATMATTPTKKHPKSAIPQLSYDCRRKNRHSRKKSLRRSRVTGYSHSVAANSATGLRIPNDNSAPEHAAKACFLLPDAPRSMAVRAGASSEAPGSELPGNANPVRAATNGFASVDGSEKSTNSEDAIMATTPTPKHPKSAIPQLSYDCRRKLHRAQMVV
ncbi:ash family protein, partial [Salmonella enterica]|nr:ash family protein [Salmonella enterica]